MSSISKLGNNIIVQSDRGTQPTIFSNWTDCIVSAGGTAIGSPVFLTFGKIAGFTFSSTVTDRDGPLTTVNGIDVSAFTAPQIVTLISSSVLTQDKFSGTPTVISDTTQHIGPYTGFEVIADAVLNTTALTGTIMVNGSGVAIPIAGFTGATLPAGSIYYGTYSKIQLASGSIIAYSNL